MKREIVIEILLIGVLGIYGWLLADRVVAVRADPVQMAADANSRLPFTDGIGIDSLGQRIDPARFSGINRVVVFLLRSGSLDLDLKFWNSVGSLLPNGSGVELIGYCDGNACIEALEKNPLSMEFPVITYGEALDSQALLNADLEGNFLLAEKGKYARTIGWRGSGRTADDVARSILP